MSDALAKIVGSLEVALRYVLSGFVVSAFTVLSWREVPPSISELQDDLPAALFVIALIGFGAFTLYRLVMWTFLDPIAWITGQSAPSLQKTKGGYATPYARFLRWRYDPKFSASSLAGYLTYRWSAAHFAILSGVSAVVAGTLAEAGSFVERHATAVLIAGGICLAIGLWQCFFLFRTEKRPLR